MTPCVVGMIQKPDVCKGVLPGDSVSRVNGVPLAGSTFNGERTVLMMLFCVDFVNMTTTTVCDLCDWRFFLLQYSVHFCQEGSWSYFTLYDSVLFIRYVSLFF